MNPLPRPNATLTVMGDPSVARPAQKNFIRDIYEDMARQWMDDMKEAVSAGFQPYFVGTPDFPLAFIAYKHKDLFSDWMFYNPLSSLIKGAISGVPVFGDIASGGFQATEQVVAFERSFWSHYCQAAWFHLQSFIKNRIDRIYFHITRGSDYYPRYVEEPVTKALKTRDLQRARSMLSERWYADFTGKPIKSDPPRIAVPHDQLFKLMWDRYDNFKNEYRRMVWYQVFDAPYDDSRQQIKASMIMAVKDIAALMTTTYNAYKAQVMAEINGDPSIVLAMKRNIPIIGAGYVYEEFERRFRANPKRLVDMINRQIDISSRLLVKL